MTSELLAMIDKLSADLREMAHSRDFYIFQNAILLDALNLAPPIPLIDWTRDSTADKWFILYENWRKEIREQALTQVEGKPNG